MVSDADHPVPPGIKSDYNSSPLHRPAVSALRARALDVLERHRRPNLDDNDWTGPIHCAHLHSLSPARIDQKSDPQKLPDGIREPLAAHPKPKPDFHVNDPCSSILTRYQFWPKIPSATVCRNFRARMHLAYADGKYFHSNFQQENAPIMARRNGDTGSL